MTFVYKLFILGVTHQRRYRYLYQVVCQTSVQRKMNTHTIVLQVFILAGSSRFSALFSQNAKLLLVEHGTPLVLALLDFRRGIGHISWVWVWSRF